MAVINSAKAVKIYIPMPVRDLSNAHLGKTSPRVVDVDSIVISRK